MHKGFRNSGWSSLCVCNAKDATEYATAANFSWRKNVGRALKAVVRANTVLLVVEEALEPIGKGFNRLTLYSTRVYPVQ